MKWDDSDDGRSVSAHRGAGIVGLYKMMQVQGRWALCRMPSKKDKMIKGMAYTPNQQGQGRLLLVVAENCTLCGLQRADGNAMVSQTR